MNVLHRGLWLGASLLVVGLTGGGCGPEEPAATGVDPRQTALEVRQESLPPLDREALRQSIANLPDEQTTAALVRVSGRDGHWLGTSGVADIHTGARVPIDARFRIGSITKTFTATVVLQLAAEHKVDLDRAIQEYLPGLLPVDYKPIAVRHLLNHTHGIPKTPLDSKDPQWFFENRFRTWTPAEVVALSVSRGPRFDPGTQQEYGNIGYIVAGLLIEKVTGHPYGQEVRDRILRPLHLRNTSVPGTDTTIPGPHARGYEAVVQPDGTTQLVDITEANPTLGWSAAEMISTTADLDRFLTALFRGELLPPAQLEEMFTVPDVPTWNGTPQDPTGGRAYYSAGLMRYTLNGIVLWAKSGDRPGYNSGMGATRDLRRRIVYVVNTTHMGQDRPEIADRIVMATFAPH
ncbi:serine hydrolase [Vitiosangium sp. GDMCC 1.1324]|uniref:serine hydrolase domain-containing protein n=1 Tax=Vitiosangium sp. (strain GDMCC 1.1324) TaxID=2138576 RepID=UPI000D3B6EA0|nr:serine hydrolase domain-containing protein [Vitiosangium sp. GDMCC 1.1324]PTL76006.1 peptidase [Vitiosangium sp. GDMCC 1.1324]